MPGPLHGVRVVDFSAVVSGPWAAMWLADQGADVIKIESPGLGDITRGMAIGPDHHGLNGLFVNCNRGKRSVVVDVNTPEGRQIVLDIAKTADVFIQNWRPGVVDRLGLGYDGIRAVRPDVIYVSISGYGPDGPYADRRVYDPIIQGLSGHVAVQINPEIPFHDLVRTIVCDKATAMAAAQSVCASLFARDRGAGGQHLVIPMLDTAISFFFPDGYMAKALLDDELADVRPTLAKSYRITRTADGHVIYFVASGAEFHALYRALGRHDWIDDPHYGEAPGRQKHLAELGAAIIEEFEKWNTAEIYARMVEEQVPCGPVLNLDDLPNDPQIIHNDVLNVRIHPAIGRVLEPRQPVRFSVTQPDQTPLAPQFGEHTDQVLAEFGFDAAAIADLKARGVAKQWPKSEQ